MEEKGKLGAMFIRVYRSRVADVNYERKMGNPNEGTKSQAKTVKKTRNQ